MQCYNGVQSEKGLQTHMETNHQGKQFLCAYKAAMIELCIIKGYMERRQVWWNVWVRFAVKYTYKECAHKEERQVCPFCNKDFLTWILSDAKLKKGLRNQLTDDSKLALKKIKIWGFMGAIRIK